MIDLDLDIILEKQRKIKLFGREIAFRNMTMEEYFKSEYLMGQLDELALKNETNIEKSTRIIQEYLVLVLEIDVKEAKNVTIRQFKRLRRIIGRFDWYDQGFDDAYIDKVEKEALKNQIALMTG